MHHRLSLLSDSPLPLHLSLRSSEVALTSALFTGTRTPRSKIASIRPNPLFGLHGRILPLVCQRWHIGRLYHCLVTVSAYPTIIALPICMPLANLLRTRL